MTLQIKNKSENVSTYIDAVLQNLHDYFSEKNITCYLFNILSESYKVPAILLNVDKMELGSDDGTGRFSLKVALSAYCIINREDNNTRNSKILRDIAADLMRLVMNNNFSCEDWVHLPFDIKSSNYEFDSHKTLECVKVNWSQTIFLGTNIWEESKYPIPKKIYLSHSPKIGKAYEGDYICVAGNI